MGPEEEAGLAAVEERLREEGESSAATGTSSWTQVFCLWLGKWWGSESVIFHLLPSYGAFLCRHQTLPVQNV